MNQISRTTIEQYFGSSDQELHIGEIAVSDIVARHGTPAFVYDRQILDSKLELLSSMLPSDFAISYSVKANPNRTFLQYFLNRGCGLEIASGGELYQALEAGCSPEKIVFAGPGKSESELEYALSQNIAEIHVESLLEAERITRINRRLGLRSKIALRINPSQETQGGSQRMGGLAAPFGIDEEALESVLNRLKDSTHIDICGVHVFAGTQILDHTIIVEQFRKGLELARQVASHLGEPLRTLDFGGGFGIPYFDQDQPLGTDVLGRELAALMTEFKDDPWLAGTRYMVEPGRFLVAEAGVYLVRVSDIKMSRGKKFLIVDGGMHHHLAASGNLGQIIKRNFPIAILNKLNSKEMETVDVVGPLCTPLDVLGRSVDLPCAQVGDLIGVFQSGAYARSASPTAFLSHLTPPEIWIEEGRDHLIRSRGTYEDYVKDYSCAFQPR